MPLLRERIAIMREVGFILCNVRTYVIVMNDACPCTELKNRRATVDPSKAFWTNFKETTTVKAPL